MIVVNAAIHILVRIGHQSFKLAIPEQWAQEKHTIFHGTNLCVTADHHLQSSTKDYWTKILNTADFFPNNDRTRRTSILVVIICFDQLQTVYGHLSFCMQQFTIQGALLMISTSVISTNEQKHKWQILQIFGTASTVCLYLSVANRITSLFCTKMQFFFSYLLSLCHITLVVFCMSVIRPKIVQQLADADKTHCYNSKLVHQLMADRFNVILKHLACKACIL